MSLYKTGDLQNNIEKLKRILRSIHFQGHFDVTGIVSGDASSFLPIIDFSLMSFSRNIAKFIIGKGYDFYIHHDLKFIQGVFKFIRTEFGYQPCLQVTQFLQKGFAERKVIFLCKLIHHVKIKNNELVLKRRKRKKKLGRTAKGEMKSVTTFVGGRGRTKGRKKKSKFFKSVRNNVVVKREKKKSFSVANDIGIVNSVFRNDRNKEEDEKEINDEEEINVYDGNPILDEDKLIIEKEKEKRKENERSKIEMKKQRDVDEQRKFDALKDILLSEVDRMKVEIMNNLNVKIDRLSSSLKVRLSLLEGKVNFLQDQIKVNKQKETRFVEEIVHNVNAERENENERNSSLLLGDPVIEDEDEKEGTEEITVISSRINRKSDVGDFIKKYKMKNEHSIRMLDN